MNSASAEIARTENGIHCRGDWTVRHLGGLEGALLSSLTVADNVAAVLREHAGLSDSLIPLP